MHNYGSVYCAQGSHMHSCKVLSLRPGGFLSVLVGVRSSTVPLLPGPERTLGLAAGSMILCIFLLHIRQLTVTLVCWECTHVAS